VVAILRDPTVTKKIEDMGAVADPLTPDQFGQFVRSEVAKWREVARAGNVKLEG
jgi:tripartite-type tricarboxylate transporter receptor subunit TctC